jgi:uncharacterized membrane protein
MSVHRHGGDPGDAPALPAADARRARLVLAALVVPVLVLTVVGLVRLWPTGATAVGSLPETEAGVAFVYGTVVGLTDVPGEEVQLALDDGGTVVPVQAPPEILQAGVDDGARMKVLFIPEAMGSGSPYVYVDYVRTPPLLLLAALYGAVVVLVARWRGLAAVLGLAASLAVVAVFVLPALLAGSPPLLVALVGSSAMMFAAVYLAHGISIRTTTALVGTIVGLVITTLLAAWGTGAAHLTGTGTDGSYALTELVPGLSLSALLLCGMVIAGLGALNDVTITQASAVWELHASDPAASARAVFTRAMRIGRDHIASTVYTLAFAYVGAALPTLLLVALYDRALLDTLTAAEIAEEVVRTLVSSIGLVLAIPVTTAIGALVVGAASRRAPAGEAPPAGDGEPAVAERSA